jgi:hypothetical protein
MHRGTGSEARAPRGLRRTMAGLLVCGLALAGAFVIAVPALAAPPPAALSPSPPSLDFGTFDMHFQQTREESYFNNSLAPVTVQSVAIVGTDASSYSIQSGQNFCIGQTIQPGTGCQLNVIFGPSSSPGPKDNAALELVDDTGTVDVPLLAAAATGTLTANQSSLDLGAQVVNQGNPSQQSVTLATGQDFGVAVTNVQINGPDASSFSVQGNGCQGFTMGTSNTCQIYIQFQPSSAGSKSAQLEIDNDGTTSPLFVSLSGVGLNGPVASFSPSQGIYGNVTLGSSASQTFTLTNTGDAPLQVQQLFLITGSPQVFPMIDGCSGQQLAPRAACQVTIGFIPIAPGGKDATLLVISNQGPVTLVGLSGTGVASNPVPTGPQGPTGAQGRTGAQGPAGSTGAAGKNGLVLVTCKTITQTVAKNVHPKRKKVTVSRLACTTNTVTGSLKLTTAWVARAVLSRDRVVYATGVAARSAKHPQLVLSAPRTLRAGHYTLTLRWTTGRTTHQTIMLR